MEARKCDVCGGFFLPYIASNKIGGKSDSYNEIIVKEKRNGIKKTQIDIKNMMSVKIAAKN